MMSRGFVREDDQEDVPMVPERAYLPRGVANFVTPAGMEQLLAEREMLIKERETLNIASEKEKRIEVNYLNAKLKLLNNRIAEAKVVVSTGQPEDEVRFGAIVTLKAIPSGTVQVFQIVGVDEADVGQGKVSFISPLARALISKKKNDKISLKRESEETRFEIIKIEYPN